MLYPYPDINILEKKFTERKKEFKNFENITEEDIEKVNLDIEKSTNDNLPSLQKYIKVLSYLTSPLIVHTYPSYDLRVLYFIHSLDKDLNALKEYLNTYLPNLSNRDEDEIRKENANIMRQNIREKVGFYNSELISFELAYYNKFYKKEKFINSGNKENLKNLFKLITSNFSLQSLTDEDYERLTNTFILYEEKVEEITPFKTAFHILNQNNILKLKNYHEQVAFFIMAIDPNLNLLRIYEEESKMPEVKRRALEELGFYDPSLITAERAYHERFMPDVKLSIWSK